jgi:endoglucanase
VLTLSLVAIVVSTGCGGHARPALGVRGNTLIDAHGKPVRLLGINRSGMEYPCIQGWGFADGPTDERAIAAMTAWRINTVRVPLNEQCWLGINGVPVRYSGPRYRTAVMAYVTRLHEAGLYVVLDLHWNAPGRQRAIRQQPMPDLDHAPAFWKSVARAFKTDRNVVFDLYNEPLVSWHCWRDGCLLPEGWRAAGMQTLVDAVRSTGARQPIIATGVGAGNDLRSWLRYRPRDPAHNLVAGFHAYNFTRCTTPDCWEKEVEPVARSVPLIATELGQGGCSHGFIDRFMSWADSVGVSYLGWTWNPSGCRAPALITTWTGKPTAFGEGLHAHLARLRVPHAALPATPG